MTVYRSGRTSGETELRLFDSEPLAIEFIIAGSSRNKKKQTSQINVTCREIKTPRTDETNTRGLWLPNQSFQSETLGPSGSKSPEIKFHCVGPDFPGSSYAKGWIGISVMYPSRKRIRSITNICSSYSGWIT